MATHTENDSDRSRGRSPMRWSPVGQQVMMPTPGQTNKRFGIGAVNYHTGETVVVIRKRRDQIAELLTQLLLKHPTQTIYVAWDNADTHGGGEIDAVVRGAAGRLVLLYLPTYSPWLNPIERGGPRHAVATLATRSDPL